MCVCVRETEMGDWILLREEEETIKQKVRRKEGEEKEGGDEGGEL